MAGSITPYETAKGRRYRVRYRKPDKSQTDTRGFRTKKEAELFLASVTVSKATGEYFARRTHASTSGHSATPGCSPRRASSRRRTTRSRRRGMYT